MESPKKLPFRPPKSDTAQHKISTAMFFFLRKDAARTLAKVLKEEEFFDLRNKEAFKIILSVFDSITVFDSISE